MRRRLLWLLALAVLTPGIGQDEQEPFFSLSSNRTFPSNGRPALMLSALNVDALEFRVYRVADPVTFFQQLESPRMFGGRAPRPPRERTVLERLRAWKRGLRAGIRRSLRAQFTESPSAHFESWFPRTPAPVSRETRYAQAPVLNPQQLVLTFQQPVRSRSRWETQTVPVGVKEKGVYLVEAVRGDLRAYTILIVSDIVLMTKTARGRILNFVADRTTGEPISGAEVWLLTRDGRRTSVRSDAEGFAPVAITLDRPADVRIVGRRGDDVGVNVLESYSFSASREHWMGYVYTDRPVYRPGHTVQFKAILRLRAPEGYEVPAGKSFAVEIQDTEGKPVYRKQLTANANGTLRDEWAVPSTAALGYYQIAIRTGEAYMGGNFEVQEYKKPEYEVRVTPSKTRVLQGEAVQAVIDSRYYFGEPVSGATVKYSISRGRYWFPLWYDPDDESMGPPEPEDSDDAGEELNQGEGKLDEDGKLTINVPTQVSDHKFDYRYRIEARVTDAARREISGVGWLTATYGSFLLNVAPNRYFYEPGSRAAFSIQARDYDNQPVRTPVRVELLKWSWRDPQRVDVRAAADAGTSGDGSAAAELALPREGGSYRVRVSAPTPEGRTVEAYAHLWVSGRADGDFSPDPRRSVQIIPDKKTYRPGETARLLITTGRPNTPVLVSIEGRDLRQHRLLRSKDATLEFEAPVAERDQPGFFVTASFVRAGSLYTSSKYIRVPADGHKLNLSVTTDKPQYLPGETATYNFAVTDAAGKPVPRAELSLGVVDEAIYAIRRDTAPEILGFFFGREWNSVYSEDSLDYYFTGEAGKRRMRLAEIRPPSRLAQLKPERLALPKIRKVFPDTAFWAAEIVTDAAGRAQAKAPFPDSLTTWRATARGVTRDTKVGAAVLKTIVRKNLILRLAVPRFFVQGDEVVISALVHNYLATEKTARVSLDVQGLDVLEGATKEVAVPARGEARVDWRVRARAVRSAKVTGRALTDEESDALELDLPVNVPGVKLSQARGGALAAGVSAAFDLTFPERVEPGSRRLSIRVSPSIAGALFGALDYLTTFPYGCVEQTMSSFLPNIIVRQAVRGLGLKVDLDEAGLQQKIREGLERLYTFQHEDGGWGWWETDESHPFMTAYVAAGLVQAKASGVPVRQDAIEKAAAWLKQVLARDTRLAPDLRAYMVYALAGQAGAPPPGNLFEHRTRMSPYGQALLGLALEQAKDARVAEIAAGLEQSVQQDQEQAWWPASRDEMLDFSSDATPEATAYVVRLLSHQRPASPLLPKAAVWLMNHRNEGYWWSSTKQTAMVIHGLTDYLKATNELNPSLTATVAVNGQTVLSRKLDQALALGAPEIVLEEAKLQPGVNRVSIQTSGQGRLYYSVRAEHHSTEDKLQQAGSVSLNILRDYFRLVPTRSGERIVYDTVPLDGPVASGDTLAVRLTVTGGDWRYLMVEDPIPAGTEFLERDQAYELRNRPPWWRYAFTRRELHDDRMAIFQTHFPRGQAEYFYLLKVVNPGVFRVSPARVQPMYQPEVLATTESRRLEAK